MDERTGSIPEIDRLSIVTAMILLSYALTAYIDLPERSLSLQLPGFLFVVKLDIFTLISVIVAVLAAAGCTWINSAHPSLGGQRKWYHWIIPSFTALVIGVPLNTVTVSPAWWMIFGMGGVLLLGVFIAEYISVDPNDHNYSLASITLTVVSFSLFLILSIAVRGAGFRLYAVLSSLVPAAALLTTRVLHLRLSGMWFLAWAGGISLVVGQLIVGLFSLPLQPIQFSLVLTGVVYGLVTLAGNIQEEYPSSKVWREPAIMLAVFVLLSLVI